LQVTEKQYVKFLQKSDRTSQEVNHTHEGSIGNLGNDQIKRMMNTVFTRFEFSTTERAIDNLLRL